MYFCDNTIVNEMGELDITGNVVPQIWYQRITRDNGKPHLLAIAILSDIVYWYRPVEERDPETGMLRGWKKRFKGTYLQRNYAQYEEMFGESRKSIRSALETLERLGVVKRNIVSSVQVGTNYAIGNVMFLILYPEKLKELTYPDKFPNEDTREQSNHPIALEVNSYCPESNNPIALEVNSYCPESNNPIALEVNSYCPESNNPIASEGMTYTKNTTESTTKINNTENTTDSIHSFSLPPLVSKIKSDIVVQVISHIQKMPPQKNVYDFAMTALELSKYIEEMSQDEFDQVDNYVSTHKIYSEKGIIAALLNARFYVQLNKNTGMQCNQTNKTEIDELEKILLEKQRGGR